MATVGSLVVNLLGNSRGFSKAMDDAQGTLNTFQAAATGALLGMAAAGASASIKLAADMEQVAISMETLLGSADAAKAKMEEMRAFALATPFEFADVAEAGKRMLALGFSAEQIIPTLQAVGDAVSSLGGGKEKMDRIVLALGQINAKGKVKAQEMNQLAEAGIGAWQMLADTLGTSIPEAMDMAEKGLVSSARAIPAIIDGMNAKFGGGMEKQFHSLTGQWNNLKETLATVGVAIGNSLLPALKTTIAWTRAMVPLIAAVAAFILVIIAVTAAQRAYAMGQIIVLSLQGPKGWLTLAAAAGVAAIAFNQVNSALQGVTDNAAKAHARTAGLQETLAADIPTAHMDARAKAREHKQSAVNDAFKQMADAQDQLKILNGELTETDIKVRDIWKAGASMTTANLLRADLDALEARKKSIKEAEDAESRLNEQRQRGLAITEQFASPAETARKKTEELSKLLEAGHIDSTTFQKGYVEANKPKTSTGTAALQAGTKEAFSAFQAYQRDQGKDPVVDEAKKQTKAIEAQTKYLASIDKSLATDNSVPVKL